MPASAGESLESLIQRSAARLDRAGLHFGHGTDNALDEAHWLVLHAIGLPVEEPVADYALALTADEIAAAEALIERRVGERRPAAYLTGSAWFAGLEFFVDERCLVPRSPIAELIVDGFSAWLDPAGVDAVLDLCTGGGCIAIACAHAFPAARVDAVDLSPAALEVARINIQRYALDGRVSALQGDLFAPVAGRRYRLIVSNPPYVDAADLAAMPAEYRREPQLGLAAGDDGLEIAARILREARAHLADDGILCVEVGNSAAALEARFPELPFLWLEFASGDGGVFVLSAAELDAAGFAAPARADGFPRPNHPEEPR